MITTATFLGYIITGYILAWFIGYIINGLFSLFNQVR
jgi:hypothetical protein